MIVSRRSMLLSQPSDAIMRAAGYAASEQAFRGRGAQMAQRKLDELMQRVGRGGVTTTLGATDKLVQGPIDSRMGRNQQMPT